MNPLQSTIMIDDLLNNGVFSPENTAMMKRVFNKVCAGYDIPRQDGDRLESLALVILRSVTNGCNENVVLALALQSMKNYT